MSTTIKVAGYARISVKEVGQQFTSIDAQWSSIEAYVQSRAAEGWELCEKRFEDDGYSGGSLDRPGLEELRHEIRKGEIDSVLVVRLDRLSRRMKDIVGLVSEFEQHGASFVSVTQELNTATSAGRFNFHVVSAVAHMERELIVERTRDKIKAARRQGRWTGGKPPLGYVVCDGGGTVLVDPEEAERVRDIFNLYLELQSLSSVLKEIRLRRWRMKRWKNQNGGMSGGAGFSKSALQKLLRNRFYLGKTKFGSEEYEGQHDAIVAQEVFNRVQLVLSGNDKTGGVTRRNKHQALLKGILRCGRCGCAMTPSRVKKGDRIWSYYVCSNASKSGWDSCEVKSIPAREIEGFVANHIAALGTDNALQDQVLQKIGAGETVVDKDMVRSALVAFHPLWERLLPVERIDLIQQVLESITVEKDSIELEFRPEFVEILNGAKIA